MTDQKSLHLTTPPQAPYTKENAPWLKHYEPGRPQNIKNRNIALHQWLDEAADDSPDKPACIFANVEISYAELRERAEKVAANLKKDGVMPGDRVGLMLPNIPQTMIAFWGILKAGGVVTMINPLYMEKELLHQVGDAGTKHLITVDSCWPKFAALEGRLEIDHYYITSATSETATGIPADHPGVHRFEKLLEGTERLSVEVKDPVNTLALLQYTGGTTGFSKGAMLSHANLGANMEQLGTALTFLSGERQVIVGVLPFFHVYGLNTCLLLPIFLRAATLPVPRFVPSELASSIEKHKATILPGAPAMYIAMLQQKNDNKDSLGSLQCCISGSAPIPVEVQQRFENELGAKIIEGYGLSEASPITHLTPHSGLRKIGSIGIPLADTEAYIVDMELGIVPLPEGKIGELIIRGPQVMSGYWNNPQETAGALRDGWLYTGDIAFMDEDGFFTLVDRKKDMIIVGGYNVSPREIDEVLYEHPKVQEAVTVGVPHYSRGEIIKAYIVLKPGETAEKSEIASWCRQKLANFKVPKQIEFRDELPKTIVGKVLRRTLRDEEAAKIKDISGNKGDYPVDFD